MVLVCWATGGLDCVSILDYSRDGLCWYTELQQGWIVLVYWTTAGLDCASMLGYRRSVIVPECWFIAGLDCASILDYSRSGLC
jgi:hypothetical protein